MFTFFKNLFSKKEPVIQAEEQRPVAKKKKKRAIIPYDKNLIRGFEVEHQLLLKYYTETMQFATEKNYPKLQLSLNKFSSLLGRHLSKEDIKLYMFLDYVVEDAGINNHQFISREFRLEMRDITIAVTSVINKHTNILVSEVTIQSFIEEFGALGDVLVSRIEREEKTLYPIYSQYES